MRVTQYEDGFKPVVIILENEAESRAALAIINDYIDEKNNDRFRGGLTEALVDISQLEFAVELKNTLGKFIK